MSTDFPQKRLMLGDTGKEVAVLHSYLKRFGYMRSDSESNVLGCKIDNNISAPAAENEEIFDEHTRQALILFQDFNSLPVTGVFDLETNYLMMQPRCGVPDITVREGNQEYYIVAKWTKTNLTYKIGGFTRDWYSENEIRSIISRAFNRWTSQARINVTDLTFTPSPADIRIRWRVRDHGDGLPFDGCVG